MTVPASSLIITDPLAETLVKAAKTPTLGALIGPQNFRGRAQGTFTLFRVSGVVKFTLIAVCNVAVAGTNATIEVGVTGATASIIPETTASNLAANEIWLDSSPTTTIENNTNFSSFVNVGNDIIATIGTAALTAGEIAFYLYYEPISPDGKVTL